MDPGAAGADGPMVSDSPIKACIICDRFTDRTFLSRGGTIRPALAYIYYPTSHLQPFISASICIQLLSKALINANFIRKLIFWVIINETLLYLV